MKSHFIKKTVEQTTEAWIDSYARCYANEQLNYTAAYHNHKTMVAAVKRLLSACKTGVGFEPLNGSLEPNPFSEALKYVENIVKKEKS